MIGSTWPKTALLVGCLAATPFLKSPLHSPICTWSGGVCSMRRRRVDGDRRMLTFESKMAGGCQARFDCDSSS
jgi:hypothetical protein